MNDLSQLRFILYVRKSTDTSDRQVQSLEDQTNLMQKVAFQRGLKIIKTITESKSAKSPNARDGFSEMIEMIENNLADGIITYAFDRLSRNPIDSATIKWLLQREKIKRIVTSGRDYHPEDNVLLLSIEDGLANEYIRKLKKDVRRGMVSKFEKGIYPSMAPIGYRNCPYDRDIKPDKKYFPLIRKMWDMLLSGNYQVPDIHKIAVEEWNLKSPKRKKLGGKIISRSLLYKIFHNPFYMGIMRWDGMLKKGNHKPMVTPKEFKLVQKLIKSNTKAATYVNKHNFTGIMRCPICNCQITGETKHKANKSYTYYYCTGRAKYTPCDQIKKRVTKSHLISEIENILKNITISKPYFDLALEYIEKEEMNYHKEFEILRQQQFSEIEKAEERKKRLADFVLDGVIKPQDYQEKMKELDLEILTLRSNLAESANTTRMKNKAMEVFEFMHDLSERFRNSPEEDQKNIFKNLGQNHGLIDKKVVIELSPWFKAVKDFHAPSKNKSQRSELDSSQQEKDKPISKANRSRWCTTVKRIWKMMVSDYFELHKLN